MIEIDDGGTFLFYSDSDNDGFGSIQEVVESCFPPEGYVNNHNDCDDFDTSISPMASELCDGTDNNCNEVVDDDAVDRLRIMLMKMKMALKCSSKYSACAKPDGYVDSSDCDDTRDLVNPAMVETCDERQQLQ